MERNEKLWPDDRAKSLFVPIAKKGDALECCKNRTIAPISHCSKTALKNSWPNEKSS